MGRYIALFDLLTPPLTQFPPGYPLFLVPFLPWAHDRWYLLEIPSLLLMLLAIYLLWKWTEGWVSPRARWLVCGLFAFNSVTLVTSNAVMSDQSICVSGWSLPM